MKERNKKMTREQHLQEFCASLAAGATMSILLVAILCDVATKAYVVVCFMAFWFFSTVTVWTIIDFVEWITAPKERTAATSWFAKLFRRET